MRLCGRTWTSVRNNTRSSSSLLRRIIAISLLPTCDVLPVRSFVPSTTGVVTSPVVAGTKVRYLKYITSPMSLHFSNINNNPSIHILIKEHITITTHSYNLPTSIRSSTSSQCSSRPGSSQPSQQPLPQPRPPEHQTQMSSPQPALTVAILMSICKESTRMARNSPPKGQQAPTVPASKVLTARRVRPSPLLLPIVPRVVEHFPPLFHQSIVP